MIRIPLGLKIPQLKTGVVSYPLAYALNLTIISPMKFALGIVAYLVIGLVLGLGMLQAVKGQPWLLIIGFLAYAIAFGKIGCLPKKSH